MRQRIFIKLKKSVEDFSGAPTRPPLMGRINLEVRLQFALGVQFSIFLCSSGNANSQPLAPPRPTRFIAPAFLPRPCDAAFFKSHYPPTMRFYLLTVIG